MAKRKDYVVVMHITRKERAHLEKCEVSENFNCIVVLGILERLRNKVLRMKP